MCVYLIDVIEFEVFQQQQEYGWNGFDDDFFMSIHINAQLHTLKNCGTRTRYKTHIIYNLQDIFNETDDTR